MNENNMDKIYASHQKKVKEITKTLQSEISTCLTGPIGFPSTFKVNVSVKPIKALRCIEIKLPYWFKFRSCRKIGGRFDSKKRNYNFLSSKSRYDFPLNDKYFKEHYNNSKYVFK